MRSSGTETYWSTEDTAMDVIRTITEGMTRQAQQCVHQHGSAVQRLRGEDLLRLLNVGTAREWSRHWDLWTTMAKTAVEGACGATA